MPTIDGVSVTQVIAAVIVVLYFYLGVFFLVARKYMHTITMMLVIPTFIDIGGS